VQGRCLAPVNRDRAFESTKAEPFWQVVDGMEKGCLAIVLHAHLPYVRHPEFEDSLEENWLYEAITDTYIPLLMVMEGLVRDGVDFRLTFSLTPTLASMLLDPFLQSRYEGRLGSLLELSQRELERTKTNHTLNALAQMYHRRLLEVRDAYEHRYRKNLVGAFGNLQKLGKLEIIASAATHGYLPLLSVNPLAVRTQVGLGVDHYEQLFGRRPAGFWLPECAYYPGLDAILENKGVRYTILETHGITRARPRPRHGVYAPVYCPSGVAAFGRDPESSKQVWSSTEGYPGDHDYREFYRDIGYDLDLDYIKPYIHRDGIRIDTGFKYYRVTGKGNHKDLYVPERARRKAQLHAEDFVAKREKQASHLASVMERKPVIVAPFDAELFGHWWFEGPLWLDELIRKVGSAQRRIKLVTLSEYLAEYPTNEVATPCMSSWGDKGFHEVWLNGSNDWIYPHLHWAASALEAAGKRHFGANGLQRRALDQAVRELLLAQASDWAFMISSGTTVEYASKRTRGHLSRLNRLLRDTAAGNLDESWLSAIERQDNLFPALNFRSFL
jgi:1,4-alpha-glucan branching enzyme